MIGYMPEEDTYIPGMSAVEFVSYCGLLCGLPPKEAMLRAHQVLHYCGLGEARYRKVETYSTGMRQRIKLAQALVHDPDLLLLDEPFGSLDALTRERMGSELLRIWQARRKTVVMVTHSISEALFLADRVLVLSGRPGRLCLDLPVDLPRPRQESMRYTPKFGTLARRMRQAIGEI
jgi:NitT/TauT family transport system ATP-binding protein